MAKPSRGGVEFSGMDCSQLLKRLMQQAGLDSYRALSRRSGVSPWSITLLRQGQLQRLRVDALLRLSQALAVPVEELIIGFYGSSGSPSPEPAPSTGEAAAPVAALQREYERLQQQLVEQEEQVRRQVQADAIALLESWLLQWPTAAYAAQQNASLPAARLLPLTKPLDTLLHAWDIVPIGTVGADVSFDPQLHQPMGGNPQPGQRVRVRYVGYRHGDRLLYRAKVSPVD